MVVGTVKDSYTGLDRILGELVELGFKIEKAVCDKKKGDCYISFQHPEVEKTLKRDSIIIYSLPEGRYYVTLIRNLEDKDLIAFDLSKYASPDSTRIAIKKEGDSIELFVAKLTDDYTVRRIIKAFYEPVLKQEK